MTTNPCTIKTVVTALQAAFTAGKKVNRPASDPDVLP
jgi:hypothetical protein